MKRQEPLQASQRNPYITAQIINMQAAVRNCQQSCHWAARQDDGTTDDQEARTLKKIDHIVERFVKELERLK